MSGCAADTMDNFTSNTTTTPSNVITSGEHAARIVLATFAILVTILGLFGNSLVILSVGLSQKLQTATNVFVTNLAVADLLTCSMIPWNVVALLSYDGWPVAEWICGFAAFTLYLCIGCSIWNLTNIAINRYFVITLSVLKFKELYTRRKLTVMVVLTWFVPALLIGVPILAGVSELGYDEVHGTCSDRRHDGMGTRLGHILVQAIVLFIIPMFILVICYIKIYCHVRMHTRQMAIRATNSVKNTPVLRQKVRTRNKQRTFRLQTEITKNSFYILCAFLICVIPFAVTLSVYQEGSRYASVILLSNAALNPLIYSIKHPHFKKIFFKILRCQWHSIPGRPDFLRQSISNEKRGSKRFSLDGLRTKGRHDGASRDSTKDEQISARPASATSSNFDIL